MTKKIHIRAAYLSLIILALGFFATPTLTYACGTKIEKSCCKKGKCCCKKEVTNKAPKKSYCKKHISRHAEANELQSDNHKTDDGCDGKCGDPSCNCPTFNFAIALPFIAEMTSNNFAISSKKQKFYDKETHLSSGFYYIWIPPNIG
jgi:hypothetical protein